MPRLIADAPHAARTALAALQKEMVVTTGTTLYELDVRFGTVRTLIAGGDRNERRRAETIDDTRGAYTFEPSVDALRFYATFEALYRHERIVAVTECTVSEHDTFALAPNARRERPRGVWIEKEEIGAVIDVPLATHNCWFDIRFACSREVVVEPPRELTTAMALYDNERAPPALRKSIAPKALPSRTRRRTRRSLFFSDTPAWRVDATHVDLLFGDGVSDKSSHCEIELEYIASIPPLDIDDATHQCIVLIERIATALGTNEQEIAKQLNKAKV